MAAGGCQDDDPPAELLAASLAGALRRSREPELRRLLGRDAVAAAAGAAAARSRLAPLVSRALAPALDACGLPPGEEGAERLRHAVQRRIAEGHDSLELLALEARQLVDFEEWPDPELEAEEFLASKVDETLSRCEGGSLDRRCSELLDREARGGAVPPQTLMHLRKLLERRAIPTPSVISLLVMAKIGMPLKILSSPVERSCSSVPVLHAPSSTELFRSNVLPSRPAILRGCFDRVTFPPLEDFPSFAWLRRQCGHRRVPVKSYMHDDQAGRHVFLGDPSLRLPLCAYLSAVEAHEHDGARMPFYLGKVPLRHELPELAQAIDDAPTCPGRLYGECFGELKPEGVFTYLGCGRNTTPVHFDAHENLLLCLCGRKRLWLYQPSDARYLYPVNDFTRSAVVPFAVPAEIPEELRSKFELAGDARPVEVELGAGDMLYLPACWWHCVEGSEARNMILNWWFVLHPDKAALARGLSADAGPAGAADTGAGQTSVGAS